MKNPELNIPKITAEEAMDLTWYDTSVDSLKEAEHLFRSIMETPHAKRLDGTYRLLFQLAALWNAGRVQGIREERARRKHKIQNTVK